MKIAITIPVYINNENHLYFTIETLKSIETSHDFKVFLVENYLNPDLKQKLEEELLELTQGRVDQFVYLRNPDGNCVAGGWNTGVKKAFEEGYEFVVIPNNDIIFHPLCLDNLVKYWQDNKEGYVLWSALTHDSQRTIKTVEPGVGQDDHPGFSLFAVSKEGVENLAKAERGTAEPDPGFFDSGFTGAYFEDQDYHQRILRAGFIAGKTATALYYHFGSRTIKTDEALNLNNFTQYENNRQYFKRKWGYDAHGRGFANEERVELGYKTAFNRR